ncbi:ribonuclease H-like domain-containing protein [Tanacetum coccineum]
MISTLDSLSSSSVNEIKGDCQGGIHPCEVGLRDGDGFVLCCRGLLPMARNWTARSIFGKLILAATSYFIWIERNNCLFKNLRRSPKEVIDIIIVTVRLKLITFWFKNTSMVNQLLDRWKMLNSVTPFTQKNVPNDADFDIWLPLASVHGVNDRMKNSLYGYFIDKRLAFLVVEWFVLNNWKKHGLEKVRLVKDFFLFKFTSTEGVDSVLRDGPWMIHRVLIFLNKWPPSVSLFKEELSRVPVWVNFHDVPLVAYTSDGYARILIEIDACNGFSDNLVMVVPNIDGPGYTKETIRVKYEWKPPRCSTVDKDKGGSSTAYDVGFIEVKKKKSGGNNGGTKNFKPVLVKPKTIYCPKVNQPTEEVSHKIAPSAGKKKVSTTEEGKSYTPLVEKINMIKQQLLEGKGVLVDDDGKPLKKVDYLGDHDSEDEVEPVEIEMAIFLASKSSGVGYGTNSLLEQCRETYGKDDYNYDPYDDDIYEGREIPDNIQSICDNLDIKVSCIEDSHRGMQFTYVPCRVKGNCESSPHHGHLTLIKVVLRSLRIFYLSIFKVPKSVLKNLESIRALFFWRGTHVSKELAWIKWPNVLTSFDKGWLGVGCGTRTSSYLSTMLAEISHVDIASDTDACVWSLSNDGIFSHGVTLCHIDDCLLPSLDPPTLWDKTLPRKVNMFMWRLRLDRLQHRLNISYRGIEIYDI